MLIGRVAMSRLFRFAVLTKLLGHDRARYFHNTDDRGASAEAQAAVGIEAAG
jgi:hypothetical protein